MNRSEWRWMLVMMAVLACGGVGSGLWWLRGEVRLQARPALPAPPASAMVLSAQGGVLSAQTTPALADPSGAAAVSGRPEATRKPGWGEVEVCGDKPTAHERLQGLHIGSDAAHPLKPGLLAVAQELAAGDALARAVATLLAHQVNRGDAALPEAERSQIVASALGSKDPGLWLLAWRLCGYGQEAIYGSCSAMHLQGWIDRDPGNGAPWLWVAQQAANAGQTQALEDAMYRISQATVMEPHWSALARVQGHPALAPERGLPAMLVSIWLIGYQVATPLPSYGVLTRYCGPAELSNANRRLRCDAVARLMTTQGRTMMDMAIGHRLAQWLGWDAERLQALQDYRDAMSLPEIAMGDGRRSFDVFGQVSSCQAHREMIQHYAEVTTLGEAGAMQRRIAASGATPAELGDRARQRLKRAHAEFAAAAAASAAASAAAQPLRP